MLTDENIYFTVLQCILTRRRSEQPLRKYATVEIMSTNALDYKLWSCEHKK